MNKYNNKKTIVDNITFHSKKEAKRYGELKLLEKSGEIFYLKLQERYALNIGQVKICTYVSDFTYIDKNGLKVVEDTKGMRTQVYKLKAKLMLAIYGITILET